MVAFIILSAVCLVLAVFTVSKVTIGVGIVGLACYFAILAHMCQAHKQYRRIMDRINENENKGVTPLYNKE